MPTDDPILQRFLAALDKLYESRLDRVILYGSRARGEAHPDSDYDIAVFLKDMNDRWIEFDRLTVIETDILYDTGEVIHAMPFLASRYAEASPLMQEIRREGVDL